MVNGEMQVFNEGCEQDLHLKYLALCGPLQAAQLALICRTQLTSLSSQRQQACQLRAGCLLHLHAASHVMLMQGVHEEVGFWR